MNIIGQTTTIVNIIIDSTEEKQSDDVSHDNDVN